MFYSERDFFEFVVLCIGAGVLLGLFFAFGVPWLWGLVKPWLHAVTV